MHGRMLLCALLTTVAACSGRDAEPAAPTTPEDASATADSALDGASAETTAAHDDAPTDTRAPIDTAACPTPVAPDPLHDQRGKCAFAKGARVLDTLGVTPEARAKIPI